MELKQRSRKIINLNYSYWISLPINWCKNHNIGKGDKIEPIILENGDLLLKPFYNEVKNDTTQ